MATRNHTKDELLAQLEQARVEIQRLASAQKHLDEVRALFESSQLALGLANERIRELTEERDETRFELRLARQRPQRGRNTQQIGIPMELRAAFFRDTGKTSATAKEIRAWEGNL